MAVPSTRRSSVNFGGARHFCQKIYVWKINKMSEFCVIFVPQKLTKTPEFYVTFARKIFIPIFFWGGEGEIGKKFPPRLWFRPFQKPSHHCRTSSMCWQGVLDGSSVPHVYGSTAALWVPEGLRLRPHTVLRGQVQLHVRAYAFQGEATRPLLTTSPTRPCTLYLVNCPLAVTIVRSCSRASQPVIQNFIRIYFYWFQFMYI